MYYIYKKTQKTQKPNQIKTTTTTPSKKKTQNQNPCPNDLSMVQPQGKVPQLRWRQRSVVIPSRQHSSSWQVIGLLANPCSHVFRHLPCVGPFCYQAFRLTDSPSSRPPPWEMWRISGEACRTPGHESQSRRRLQYESPDQAVRAQNSIHCTLYRMGLAFLREISDLQRPQNWAFEKQGRLVLGTLDSRGHRSRVSFMSERNDIESWRLTLSSPVLPRRTIHSRKPGPSSGSGTQAKIERGCKKKCVYFCDFPLCLLPVL